MAKWYQGTKADATTRRIRAEKAVPFAEHGAQVIRRAGLISAGLILAASGAAAASVQQVNHDELARILDAKIDFEGVDASPEPGREIDRLEVGAGAKIDSHLAGMERRITRLPDTANGGRHFHPTPNTAPGIPLRLAAEGTFVVAEHRGFGSSAAFPVGPDGAGKVSGRGEGMLTVLFDADQYAVALRIHSDYPDPMGTRPPPGQVLIEFRARDGRMIDMHRISLDRGVTELGFRSPTRGMAAITISNTDPGGIAIDDIVFALAPLTG